MKNWKIVNLEVKTKDGDRDNVAIVAHWSVSEIVDTHTGYSYGSVGLDAPSDDFVALDKLTEEIVVGWVKAKLGEESVTNTEKSIDAQIEALKNPPTFNALPWVVMPKP